MENKDKGLTAPKWPKIPQIPQNLSVQIVWQAQNFGLSMKEASLGVRNPCSRQIVDRKLQKFQKQKKDKLQECGTFDFV